MPGNNPLGNGNAGDGSGGGLSDDGDGALPASAPSNRDAVGPLMNGIHQVAGVGKTALNIAAGFNPICNALTALSGQDAEGCHVSPPQQGLSGVAAAAPIIGALGKALEGVANAGNATKRQMDAARHIINNMNEHLKEGPSGKLADALKDLVGRPIPKSSDEAYDHMDEIRNGYKGLLK